MTLLHRQTSDIDRQEGKLNTNDTSKIEAIKSIRGSTTRYTSLFIGENTHIPDATGIDTLKIALLKSPEDIQKMILSYVETHQPITNGQEGEIYKIQLEDKKYIVAKKRFDTASKHEYNMHQEFFKASINSKSGIKVPEIVHEFQNEENGYLLMEYIEGKTLYTLIWQEIVNTQLIPLIKKHCSRGDYLADRCLNDLKDFINNYGAKGNQIEFSNDRDTISGMETICSILYDLGIIDGTFHKSETIPGDPIKRFPIEEKLLDKYIGKIGIFEEERYNEILRQLQIFIHDLHNQGIYHRDLGKNFRNIMFTQDSTYVIDFGRSIKVDNPYGNYDYENDLYIKDESIIANIKKTQIRSTSQEELIEVNTDEIIQKASLLGLNINEALIETNRAEAKNRDLVKVFSDFVEGNDRMYNWFIYSKKTFSDYEQQSTKRGKEKLFVLLQMLTQEKKEKLRMVVNENLQARKNTKKYKYAKIFDKYLNA